MATISLQAQGTLPLITGSGVLIVKKPSELGMLDRLEQFLELTDKGLKISKSICEVIELVEDWF